MCHRYLICQLTGEGEKGAGQLGDLEVVTLAAAPEIRPAGGRRASGGTSPWKSLFIPPHTKTGLLTLTHNKCFLSGRTGLELQRRSSLFAFRSVIRSFLPLSLFTAAPFSFEKKTVSLLSLSLAACKPGYFKASEATKFCQVCPQNTKTSAAGATECQCEDGFFRSPTDSPTSACSGKNPLK